MKGIDRWTGSSHEIRVGTDGVFVILSVEATSGANEGECLITPGQAKALCELLRDNATEADRAASEGM